MSNEIWVVFQCENNLYKVLIFWEGHKILWNLHQLFVYCQSNNWWTFCIILRPFQNIWTLRVTQEIITPEKPADSAISDPNIELFWWVFPCLLRVSYANSRFQEPLHQDNSLIDSDSKFSKHAQQHNRQMKISQRSWKYSSISVYISVSNAGTGKGARGQIIVEYRMPLMK